MLLSRSLPANLLQAVKVAVFGLGDSSYVNYNFAAKMLLKRYHYCITNRFACDLSLMEHHRMTNLGAHALLRRGDGDDQHKFGMYGDLFPWMEELFNELLRQFPLPSGVELIDPNVQFVQAHSITIPFR
jgi:sulfite reductase alpha subunit-like flavoprotein